MQLGQLQKTITIFSRTHLRVPVMKWLSCDTPFSSTQW